jgi:hypothetical protein
MHENKDYSMTGKSATNIPDYLLDAALQKAADLSEVPWYAFRLSKQLADYYSALWVSSKAHRLDEHITFREYVFENSGGGDVHAVAKQLSAIYVLFRNRNFPMRKYELLKKIGTSLLIPGYEWTVGHDGKVVRENNYNGLTEAVTSDTPLHQQELHFIGKEYSVPRLKRLAHMFPKRKFDQMARITLRRQLERNLRKDKTPKKDRDATVELLNQVLGIL